MIFQTRSKLPHSQWVGRYIAGLWDTSCSDLTAPRSITTSGARKNAATIAPPSISPAGRTGDHARPRAFPSFWAGPGSRGAVRAARGRSATSVVDVIARPATRGANTARTRRRTNPDRADRLERPDPVSAPAV